MGCAHPRSCWITPNWTVSDSSTALDSGSWINAQYWTFQKFYTNPQFWPTDWLCRLMRITVHRAKPLEPFGGLRSAQVQCGCEYPQPGQSNVSLSARPHAQPNSSMSAALHHLQQPNPVGTRCLCLMVHDRRCSGGRRVPYLEAPATTSEMESGTDQSSSFQNQRHDHHFGEAPYESHRRTPGCMTFHQLSMECCILHWNCSHKQRRDHRSEEALCENHLQIPGCKKGLHPTVEYCIDHRYYVHKPRQCHHLTETPYEIPQMKPECTTLPRRCEVCRIVHGRSTQKLQHCHHSEEARHEIPLQQHGYSTSPEVNLEECIDHENYFRKIPLGHHFGEAQYGSRLQKPDNGSLLHSHAVECRTVQTHSFHKPRHGRRFEEARYDHFLHRPGCRRFPHPELGYCILQNDSIHKRQHDHHFEEAACETCLLKPWVS